MVQHRLCYDFAFKFQEDWVQRLTWHDPLADQFLPCASLLEFELEDCMEAEEVWGDTRGEQIVSGNYRLLFISSPSSSFKQPCCGTS